MRRQSAVHTYESVQLNQVLEEALHPGGINLTARMAEVASLDQTLCILDVGCGRGTSLLFYARQYGIQGKGVDLSPMSIATALDRCATEEMSDQVQFAVAGACELPCADATFDVVFSECTLSLVPDKPQAFREMVRVVKPGGKIIVSDIALNHTLSASFKEELGFVCCFTEALTLEGYQQIAAEVGLELIHTEDHSMALKQTAFQVSKGYGSLDEFWNQFGQGNLPCCGSGASSTSSTVGWRELFQQGRPGYWLLAWQKPDV